LGFGKLRGDLGSGFSPCLPVDCNLFNPGEKVYHPFYRV
jgi:hypothetical protein